MDANLSAVKITDTDIYGCNLLREWAQPQRELFGYALTRGRYGKHLQWKYFGQNGQSMEEFKFLSPVEHLINYVRLAWGEEVLIESRGYVNKPMLRIWENLCLYNDLGIAGSAGCSKSHGVAVWALVDWLCAPNVTSTFMASTTFEAQEQRIWGHTSKLFKACKFKIGSYLDYKRTIVCENITEEDAKKKDRDYINSIKALAFSRGAEGQAAVDSTRGRHNKRVRMIVDELAEMEPYVNKVRSNLRANMDFVYIGIANPRPGENPHRELCEPKDARKWDSINEKTQLWDTRTGQAMFIHGEESPNFEAPESEEPPFDFLQTRESLADILTLNYGNRNSLDYYRNAIGFWPPDTIQTTVISRSDIQAADAGFEPQWKNGSEKIRIASLDCAQTAGGDRNILSFGFLSELREDGRKVVMFQGQKGYVVNIGVPFEQDLAQQVVDDLIKLRVKPENFGVDISGDGGKILSAIIQYWNTVDPAAGKCESISSSGKPTERMVGPNDARKSVDVYDRLVTEYAFSLYHMISGGYWYGFSLESDDELISELTSRTYVTKNKKLSILPKPEYKKLLGKSPDKSDSKIMLGEMARRRGLSFTQRKQTVESVIQDEIESLRDEEEVSSYTGEADSDGFR